MQVSFQQLVPLAKFGRDSSSVVLDLLHFGGLVHIESVFTGLFDEHCVA